VDRTTRDNLLSLLMAALNEDSQEVADYLLQMGAASDRTDLQQLASDIGRMLAQYGGFRSTAEAGIGQLLDQLLGLVLRHGVRMQPALAAIAKSLMVTEGVCLTLDKDFDAQGVVRDEAQRLMLGRLNPTRLAGDAIRMAKSLQRYATLLPRQVNQVLQ
jgi:ubiquinone biosynthesis protein